MDVKQNLRELGLSPREIELYLPLLYERKPFSIWQLSKRIGLPRTTVYNLAEKLVEKKLAHWVVGSKVRKLQAVKPAALDALIQEKKIDYEHTKSAVASIQDALSAQSLADLPNTQVRYYQGVSGLKQLIWNTLEAENGIKGYSEFGRVEVVGKAFYENYVRGFNRRQIFDQVITNETGLSYIQRHVLGEDKHQLKQDGIRIIPKERYYITGDHSIYNNIYSVSYWKGGEVVGVEIENAELVKTHLSLFQILWGLAEPLEEYL